MKVRIDPADLPAELRAQVGDTPAKRAKYNNSKTVADGITFDSRAEYLRYQELLVLQRAGFIEGLRLQPSYILLEGLIWYDQDGKRHKQPARRYIGDFEYTNVATGRLIVEDVKGVITDVFSLKAAMFRARYSATHTLVVISKTKSKGRRYGKRK